MSIHSLPSHNTNPMQPNTHHALSAQRLKVLFAGICGLMLMLGVARFAYTPMLPRLLADAGLDTDQGSWLASINYLGYLSGALIAANIDCMQLKDRLYRWGILLALLTTAMMALNADIWVWAISRYLAGLAAAAGILLGSGLVLNWLIRHHFRSELGVHFIGVGLGIAGCALLVELSSAPLSWQDQWWLFTAVGILLAIPAWGWLPRPGNSAVTISGQPLADTPPSRAFLRLFIIAYFFAGIAYVVSATFIVAIVDQQGAGNGNLAFLLLGLSAAPACIIWDRVARRIGPLNALIAASVLQVGGVTLPLLSTHDVWVLISAALFGGTFIGIVSLVLTMAGRYYPRHPAKMMGKMTLSYGVAQIAAPALIGWMVGKTGDYSAGLILAGIAAATGAVLLIRLRRLENLEEREIGAEPIRPIPPGYGRPLSHDTTPDLRL